jgi:hypothetical protein
MYGKPAHHQTEVGHRAPMSYSSWLVLEHKKTLCPFSLQPIIKCLVENFLLRVFHIDDWPSDLMLSIRGLGGHIYKNFE